MDLLDVGHIDRSHGLRGELVVTLTTDYPERLAPGATVFTVAGPRTVRSSRPHQHRWLVTLDGVASREAADALRGPLHAEPIDDPDALWVHDLIGADLRTTDGRSWGRVEAVLDNPASPLLELSDGTLVPVAFVVDDAGLPDIVVVDPPSGLLGEE